MGWYLAVVLIFGTMTVLPLATGTRVGNASTTKGGRR